MSYRTMTLGQVAPATTAEADLLEDDDQVWLLNLDQVEPHTGRLLSKQIVDFDQAGSSTNWFDESNVLYSKLRPYLNKVYLPDGKGLCTTELVPLKPNPDLITREYLAHYLRSEKFLCWVNEQIDGAKMPRVSMKIFWNHEINLPPLEEQKRIAAILDKADSLRRKRAQAIALADDFLRATFLDLFGDPVTNPKGWPTTSMGEFCEFYAGNSLPDGDVFEGQSNGVLHLKVGDMNLPGNEEIVSVAREWSLNAKGAIIAPAGSILIPKRGGAIATNKKRLLSRACALDPNLMAISPKFPMHQEYLFIWFSLFDLTSISSGSAVPQLNKGDLAPLEIIIPPVGELDRFMLIHSKIKDVLRRLQMASVDNTNICNALNHGCLH